MLADLTGDFAAYPKSREELTGLGISSATLKTAVSKKWLQEKDQEKYRRPTKPVAPSRPLDLNDEQAAALSRVSQDIKGRVSQTFLLEGVTGSGKTEVYLQAISQALALGRAALMLVPEISLTPRWSSRSRPALASRWRFYTRPCRKVSAMTNGAGSAGAGPGGRRR